MSKKQRKSKKLDFDSLLDELVNHPTEMDMAILGDITESKAKSSKMISGQAELLEINAFIDTHNRKPQSNSNDFNESKLARRMLGYATHAKEHADLKPFDKYDLLTPAKPTAALIAANKAKFSEGLESKEVESQTSSEADKRNPAKTPNAPMDTIGADAEQNTLIPIDTIQKESVDIADSGKPFLCIGYSESIREMCERITVDSMHNLPASTFFLDISYISPERIAIQGGRHRMNIAYLKPIYVRASSSVSPMPNTAAIGTPEDNQDTLEGSLTPQESNGISHTLPPNKDSSNQAQKPRKQDSEVSDNDLDRGANSTAPVTDTPVNPPEIAVSMDDILAMDEDFLAELCADDDEYFDIAGEYSEPADRAAPDEIGKQTPCMDFYKYEALFEDLHARLKSGDLETTRHTSVNFKQGDAFILNGVLGFIENVGEYRLDNAGKYDPRLRLVFDNGTESNILLNTLNKSLFTDKQGRRVISPADEFNDFDTPGEVKRIRTGQIYIVKTLSDNPKLKSIPNLYKIGFTKHTVEERTKNALRDTAFLESPVEVVARAECYDLDPHGLEGLIHAFLYAQRIQITLTSLDGKQYMPQEWFSIHIDDAKSIIKHIVDGNILNYRMNNTTNRLVKIASPNA